MEKASTARGAFACAPLGDTTDPRVHWDTCDLLILPFCEGTPYLVGFASSDRCLEAALRLRYEVFNLELGEGLVESAISGLDRDALDDHMTHLVLVDRSSGMVVGTYRLQTIAQALRGHGVYAAQEFDLTPLEPIFCACTELGRACLAAGHRNMRAIMLLWLGIGAFMNLHRQRYLVGCCSLTTRDPMDGWRAMKTIRAKGALDPVYYAQSLQHCSCGPEPAEVDAAISLPKLFRTYLRLGATVVSEPAIDRAFGTVDYLVMLDGKTVTMAQLDVLK